MKYIIGLLSGILVLMVLYCVVPLLADGVASYIGGIRNYLWLMIVISVVLIATLIYLIRANTDNKPSKIKKLLWCCVSGLAMFSTVLVLLVTDKGSSTYGLVLMVIPGYFLLSMAIPVVLWSVALVIRKMIK